MGRIYAGNTHDTHCPSAIINSMRRRPCRSAGLDGMEGERAARRRAGARAGPGDRRADVNRTSAPQGPSPPHGQRCGACPGWLAVPQPWLMAPPAAARRATPALPRHHRPRLSSCAWRSHTGATALFHIRVDDKLSLFALLTH
ncbi:hypothetical protein BS78_04G144000 [Paspalum vaginatum]|nr:hypothetical protein BS78_04G144000 [Paspalum vaginatum]